MFRLQINEMSEFKNQTPSIFSIFLSVWCVVVRALFDVCASVSSQACLFIPDGYATPHGTMQFGASGVVSASRL